VISRLAARLKKLCRIVANNRYFNISVFCLILLSVVLMFIEIAVFPQGGVETWVHRFNNLIVYIFILELLIRLLATGSFPSFLREYWVDVIAVLPFLPFLRFLRIFRLLRLLRMISLLLFMRRYMRAFFYFFGKRVFEYFLIFALIAFVLVFATVSMYHFEYPSGGVDGLRHEFWVTLYSLFSAQYTTDFPSTLQGKLVMLVVLFSGMGLFAILTGTVSAFMVERMKEGAIMGKLNFKDMENHLVICGWNDHVPKIIAEFQKEQEYKGLNFVVIAQIPELPDLSPLGVDVTSVYHLNKDFINPEALRFANIEEACTAIIVADTTNNRTDRDADARTVLAALTIEKLNPRIYSCAELIHPENESHLAMSGIESIVLSSNISAYMMTQASMKASIVPFYTELLRTAFGNKIYESGFPREHWGQNFDQLLVEWKTKYDAVLVGVITTDCKVLVNPSGHVVQEGERAIVIARKNPRAGC
jgi:voltage-gated potassium channel